MCWEYLTVHGRARALMTAVVAVTVAVRGNRRPPLDSMSSGKRLFSMTGRVVSQVSRPGGSTYKHTRCVADRDTGLASGVINTSQQAGAHETPR
jgi:hypothetical protein